MPLNAVIQAAQFSIAPMMDGGDFFYISKS